MNAYIYPNSISYHFLVDLTIANGNERVKSSFKFQSMWWRDPSFLELLETWWKEIRVGGSISFILTKKLQALNQKLKTWNKEKFQNIFVEMAKVETELEILNEKVIEFGMRNEEFFKETELNWKLAKILKREELYWKDKSREVWLSEGDANSKFFHASVFAKRASNKIEEIIKSNG